jgi:ATP-dependent Lon protease
MVDPILKDRMNVINTDGFNAKDKQKIANDYLLPDIYKEFNIEPEDILFPEETIKNIIENYTNSEKGVRNLKRCLTNIISKLNVWTMMNREDQEELPYKLKEVNYPYTVSLDTCSVLLNKKNTDAPPVGMYL